MDDKKRESFKELLDYAQDLEVNEIGIESKLADVDSTALTYEDMRALCIDSGYFDFAYYKSKYPDIEQSGSDGLEHFLLFGSQEGRNPNPVFQTSFYTETYKDKLNGLNPLVHYIVSGQDNDYKTHQKHIIRAKNYHLLKLYFSEGIYFKKEELKERHLNPIEHYLEAGYLEERRVCWIFDREFYEKSYPESIQHVSSFLYFIEQGEELGHHPHPLFDSGYYKQTTLTDRSSMHHKRPLADFLLRPPKSFVSPTVLFDGKYYLQNNPDVAEHNVNPLWHYLKTGYSERPSRDPHPLFSVDLYKFYADLDKKTEPLKHYLQSIDDVIPTTSHFDAFGWYRDKMSFRDNSEKALLYFLTSEDEDKPKYLHEVIELEKHIAMTVSYYENYIPRCKDINFAVSKSPKVSIVIPFFNQVESTLKCLHSLMSAKTDISFEVIIINDASSDLESLSLSEIQGVNYIANDTNLGYIASCNSGVRQATGEFVVQLNNDTLLLDGWLDALIRGFEVFPEVGLVGAMLIFPDGTLQEAGGVIWSDAGGLNFGRGLKPSHSPISYIRQTDYCSGACIMLRKEVWDSLGGYDDYYSPAYYEDTDLAFRVREKGLKVVYQPDAHVIHVEGLSSGQDESQGTKRYQVVNKEKFYKRWEETLRKHTQQNYRDRYALGNVLFIDAYTPTPDRDSGSLDILNYMEFFQKCNYKVAFLPMMNMVATGQYAKFLQQKGIEWIGAPEYLNAGEYLGSEGHLYDLVIIYRAHATYVLIDYIRECCKNAKVVYETVDLHHLRHMRQAELTNDQEHYREAAIVKRQELSNILKCDATIVLSDYEYKSLSTTLNKDLLHLVPIARPCVGSKTTFDERKDILFLGGFSHTPNIDSMRYLATEIMPVLAEKAPHIHLRVVGADVTQEIIDFSCHNITIEGYIEDLASVFDSVKLLIAPLRIGAGMKGKVVSALTHSLPCVISDVAAEGMNLSNGDGVLIVNGAVDTANAVQKLYEDNILWSDMSSNALIVAEKNFSLVTTYKKLDYLLESLSLPQAKNLEALISELNT